MGGKGGLLKEQKVMAGESSIAGGGYRELGSTLQVPALEEVDSERCSLWKQRGQASGTILRLSMHLPPLIQAHLVGAQPQTHSRQSLSFLCTSGSWLLGQR